MPAAVVPSAAGAQVAAETARTLLESSRMSLADVAFAAGLDSVRQLDATVREVYGLAPGALRAAGGAAAAAAGRIELRLGGRAPFDGRALLHFLRVHAVPGVEEAAGRTYRRSLRLPSGSAVVELALDPGGPGLRCALSLSDLRDVGPAVERVRRTADLDADPAAVQDVLARDPELVPDLGRHPGLRVPGHPEGFELAIRAVLGQQVSLASARTATERLVDELGAPMGDPGGSLTRLFPTAEAIASAGPDRIRGPRARARTLVALAERTLSGVVVLDGSADRTEAVAALTAVPGIGPWTAGYIAMRGLGDPDVVLDGDVGLHSALGLRGRPARDELRRHAPGWRPWGSYGCLHLWQRVLDQRWPDRTEGAA